MYTYNHWISKTEKPTTAKAFTYIIFFPETNHRYIGYKTIGGGSNWLKYKSSSKPVKKLINQGYIAIYSIVNWFDNAEDARTEEHILLTIHQVTKRPEFLNRCISGVKFGMTGKSMSSETKTKISSAKKGKVFSNDHKDKLSSSHKGKTHTDETRSKMSASRKGITVSVEARAKISAANKGRVHTDETKAKIGAAGKGRIISAEQRVKLSAAGKGRTHTDETRAKMSESKQIGLYVTPLGTFKTLKDASISHDCTLDTISRRCKSTSPKFKDWYFQPNK